MPDTTLIATSDVANLGSAFQRGSDGEYRAGRELGRLRRSSGGYKVIDAGRQSLAYVYGRETRAPSDDSG
jgi:hypothetical protein